MTYERPLSRMIAAAPTGLLVACIAACMLLAFLPGTGAHDALPSAAQPNGWSYPLSCCAG